MALFDNIDVDETQEIEDAAVKVSKTWIKESGAYDVEVTMFRFKESNGGANGFVIDMITADGKQITQEDWFSSKAGDTTYAVKDRKTKMPTGERKDLPGMAKLKSISRALTGDPLAFKKTEKKIIPIYDFDSKNDVDTEVDAVPSMIGKKSKILVYRMMEDKTALNSASGQYEPTHEYREINEIVGWTDIDTGKTYSELAAGTDAKSYTAFMANLEKEPIKDNRKVSKNAAVGKKTKEEAASGEPSAEAKNAFS